MVSILDFDEWNEADLLASLFLRSETIPDVASGWASGTADAVFTNFRIRGGAATVVPEPSEYLWVGVGCLGLLSVWHQLQKRTKSRGRRAGLVESGLFS